MRRFFRRSLNALLGIVTVLFVALVGVRLGDVELEGQDWAYFSYATPWLLLFIATLLLALTALFFRWKWRAMILGGLALLSMILWAQGNFRLRSPKPLPEGMAQLRVVFWNADHFEHGPWDFFGPVEAIAKFDADLVVLAESDASRGPQMEAFAKYLPDHEYIFAGRDVTLALRDIKKPNSRYHWVHRWSANCVTLDLETKSGAFRLVTFDQDSDPETNRAGNLRRLAEFLEDTQSELPTLLVGDFNTPATSAEFDVLREAGWERAFEEAGRGLGETWPLPAPVLALDQCWTQDSLQILSIRHENFHRKGHQALVIELAYPLSPPSTPLDETSKASNGTRPNVNPSEQLGRPPVQPTP